MSPEEFEKSFKKARKERFDTPYNHVYRSFERLGYDSKEPEYFQEHASEMIEALREETWKHYLEVESGFTVDSLEELALSGSNQEIIEASGDSELVYFLKNYSDHLYKLLLSNTQSRRSRAGSEFEAMIELVIIGAGVSVDSQGVIGKKNIMVRDLGKSVDLVVPGVVQNRAHKGKTVLVSAKTSLRERWAEVSEEVARTGAGGVYLATLDETISADTIQKLYDTNIFIATTKRIKDEKYADNNKVSTFEELIAECLDKSSYWEGHNYDDEELSEIEKLLQRQLVKHTKRPFLAKHYEDRKHKLVNSGH
ncbi:MULTISPECIES: type II restriction endonuclease [Corynebacterium]|uniref:type II restriction endonuclease n=1 Tax=Corynebacterium TaxID=1716 RepID=UPI00124CFDE7|nr:MULTISPECIES: type II restriction endonuclease [Corynebacterium]